MLFLLLCVLCMPLQTVAGTFPRGVSSSSFSKKSVFEKADISSDSESSVSASEVSESADTSLSDESLSAFSDAEDESVVFSRSSFSPLSIQEGEGGGRSSVLFPGMTIGEAFDIKILSGECSKNLSVKSFIGLIRRAKNDNQCPTEVSVHCCPSADKNALQEIISLLQSIENVRAVDVSSNPNIQGKDVLLVARDMANSLLINIQVNTQQLSDIYRFRKLIERGYKRLFGKLVWTSNRYGQIVPLDQAGVWRADIEAAFKAGTLPK